LKIILICDDPDSVSIDVDADIELITPETVQSGGVLSL